MVTVVERIAQVRQGIPYQRFSQLAKRLGVTEERLRNALGFSTATLHRRKGTGRFTLDESNRLYWLESLVSTAEHALEDQVEVRDFMTSSNLALGGAVPLEYARTAPGLESVQRLLLQLDYGVVV